MVPGPTPAEQVAKTKLPSAPPDVDKVAQMAVSAAAPVSASAAAAADAGLIVSDPVTSSTALNFISAGCGRWLDLVAAGQPELGRTSVWEARERATREMKRPTLQFKPAGSSKLAGMTGVTHSLQTVGTLPPRSRRTKISMQQVQLSCNWPEKAKYARQVNTICFAISHRDQGDYRPGIPPG